MCVPFQPDLFIPGKSGNSIGEALTPDSVVLCLWLDFTIPPRDPRDHITISGFYLRDRTGACALCIKKTLSRFAFCYSIACDQFWNCCLIVNV